MTNKQDATNKVLYYILYTEKENYVNYCEENELDPSNINANEHVYARALVGLGLTFERE
jgi:hypothetical protein